MSDDIESFVKALGADTVIPVAPGDALRLYSERQAKIRAGENPNVIWSNTVDEGAYAVEVVRKDGEEGEYHAVLTLVRTADAKVLLKEDVHLAYGAPFGPDVDDLAMWQEMVIKAVDNDTEDTE